MPQPHLTQRIEAACIRQVAATGLVLSVFALPAPALAQGGMIGGFVGGMVNQGFQQQQQQQSPPQYYQPPPQQQYYQPSTQQYNPQPLPQNNQPQLQQTNQQPTDQFRDEDEAERLRQKRAAALAAKKAKTQNPPADKAQTVSVDKADSPVEQKGRDDATIASATSNTRSIVAPPSAAVQPGTTLPAFPDQTAYADARNRLISLGYGPLPSGSQHCDPAKDESCYPERDSCFGSNVIQCNFSWKHGDTVIRVQTVNVPPTIAKVECVDNCQ